MGVSSVYVGFACLFVYQILVITINLAFWFYGVI